MRGCRALSEQEVTQVRESFRGTYRVRDRCLFMVGIHTGFRISELLSLKVGDVWQHDRIADHITVQRKHMKKKTESRTVRLHPEAKQALVPWLMALQEHGALQPKMPLFRSRKSKTSARAISREHAWAVLKQAYNANQLMGPLGTHSMRKTLARRAWEFFQHDLLKVQKVLGHKSIQSTISYLGVDDGEIEAFFVAA
jgi:integrase